MANKDSKSLYTLQVNTPTYMRAELGLSFQRESFEHTIVE